MDIIKISLLGVCGVILGFLMKGNQTGIRLFYYSWNWPCDHGTCCGENLLSV